MEIRSLKIEKIDLKQVASVHQQFCMMNDLKEANIDSELSKDLLREKGFIVTNSEETATIYLIRLALKDKNETSF